jgi:hypothetical protein
MGRNIRNEEGKERKGKGKEEGREKYKWRVRFAQ